MSGDGLKCRCGGEVRVGTASDLKVGKKSKISNELKAQLEEDPNMPVVFHSKPPCIQYEKLDVISFLRWIRTGKPVMN